VLDDAQQRHDPEIEVLALDALARTRAVAHDLDAAQIYLDGADQLMPSAQHLIGDVDRIDAIRARSLLTAASNTS
jgi:hypothetical protein